MSKAPEPTPGGYILIVDDHPTNVALLSTILAADGYPIRTASSGLGALRLALAAPPDLLLLDVNMPDLNGYDVCRELRASEETRDIPIIFISALDAIGDKVLAFEAGGADYITKPFQVPEVRARVATQLSLLRHRREKRRLEQELTERHRQIESLKLALRDRPPVSSRRSPAPAPPPSGEAISRQVVTVLSTELHAFNRLSEEVPPARLLADLDYHLALVTSTLEGHDAEIERFRADGVTAFFRSPAVAVRAARSIQRRAARQNLARPDDSPPLLLRIGLSTGPVLLARRGDAMRDITLIGETVSLAARLHTEARPGGILMDDATFAAAGHPDNTRRLIMRVRGHAGQLQAHELLPAAAPSSR
ncbi:MAG: response regulator [Polyangiaceae bacterium]